MRDHDGSQSRERYGATFEKVTIIRSAFNYKHSEEVAGSLRAAQAIVPVVCEITGTPRSVVDLGGGTGAWCRAFKEAGALTLRCIDHSAARTGDMLVDNHEFIEADLSRDTLLPIPSDIAVSVEVAEHLPAKRSEWLVDFLVLSAPIVLFSAAIPRQDGVNHINEQFGWYWSDKFSKRGYERRDCIRSRILFNESIPFWYRQNLTLYVDPKRVDAYRSEPLLPDGFELVHQEILKRLCEAPTLRTLLRSLPTALAGTLKNRLCRRK